ncbi:MAG: cell envelope integrity protein TolA [Pseudomonadota bacterium]
MSNLQQRLDQSLAFIASVILHALVVVALLVNLNWRRAPAVPVQTTIQASIVGVDAPSAPIELPTEQPAPPEPEPESEPEEEAEPEPVPQGPTPEELAAEAQRQTEAEAQEAEALRQAEAAQRERELREQAQETERLAREQRQREEAQRLAQEQREREEAQRIARERQEREEKARQERQARARQAALEEELRAAMAAEEARQGAVDAGLLAQYQEVIRQKVERNWIRPPGVAAGLRCEVSVRQLRNGEVVSVRVVDCAGGEVLIRSIETAVRKASPLPLPREPSLFDPNIRFPFLTE